MAKVKVDLTNVESFSRCEEGRHRARIIEIKMGKSSSDDPMLTATVEVVLGSSKGSRLFDNYTLSQKALFKLKQVLIALNLPNTGRLVLDTDKMLNKDFFIEVAHEEYDGKTRARIVEYKPLGEEALPFDEDEEEEKPAKPAKASKPKQEKLPVEAEDDDDDWDEV